jgi:hypothetical protein
MLLIGVLCLPGEPISPDEVGRLDFKRLFNSVGNVDIMEQLESSGGNGYEDCIGF